MGCRSNSCNFLTLKFYTITSQSPRGTSSHCKMTLCAKRTLYNNSSLFRIILIKRSYCCRWQRQISHWRNAGCLWDILVFKTFDSSNIFLCVKHFLRHRCPCSKARRLRDIWVFNYILQVQLTKSPGKSCFSGEHIKVRTNRRCWPRHCLNSRFFSMTLFFKSAYLKKKKKRGLMKLDTNSNSLCWNP